MEAVDPVSDFLTTRGTLLKGVTLRVYDPTKDIDNAAPWAVAVKIRGSRGPKRTTVTNGIKTTSATWTVTSITADESLSRPVLNSKILQGGETWLILDIEPDPIAERLYECQTQLSPGG